MRLTTTLLLVVASCGDDDCVDGVCANYDASMRFPGPCRSAATESRPGDDGGELTTHWKYAFEYDSSKNLTRIVGDVQGWGGDYLGGHYPEQLALETQWTYDSTGELTAIDWSRNWSWQTHSDSESGSWLLSAQSITVTSSDGDPLAYDPALFSFMPTPGSEAVSPYAELGMIKAGSTTFTWQIVSPTHWAQQSSSTDPTRSDDYYLDDRGRLVNHTYTVNGELMQGETYAYNGDLLVGAFSYDKRGNIIETKIRDGGYHEVYDYSCW